MHGGGDRCLILSFVSRSCRGGARGAAGTTATYVLLLYVTSVAKHGVLQVAVRSAMNRASS